MGRMSLAERVALVASNAYWRTRYWWMDTDDGHLSRVALFCVAVLVVIIQLIKMFIAAAMAPDMVPQEPVKAIYWWVVQLIIAIIAAVAAYALAPKYEAPPPKEMETPTVDDGQHVLEVDGDVWIKGEFVLAHRKVGEEAIKSGSKK